MVIPILTLFYIQKPIRVSVLIFFLQHSSNLEILILSKAVIIKREITLTLGHYLIADLGIFLFGNILSTKANYFYAFQPVKWTVSQIKAVIKQEDCLCSTMSWENEMLKKEKAKETLYAGHRLCTQTRKQVLFMGDVGENINFKKS